MSTQNDSVKAATRESAKRWGADPKVRLACVIAEQKANLAGLFGIKEIQLIEHEEAEEISNILCAMSKNVWYEGVLDWMREKPLLSFHVVQPWLQAKAYAVRLYGETGLAAWTYADKSLKDNMIFERAMLAE